MKICSYNGFDITVLTRDEHCPPHVHVNGDKWSARFEFAFWDDGVRLMDVKPNSVTPKAKDLEGIRQELKEPANLRKAREAWWAVVNSVCLVNQAWDTNELCVVEPRPQGANRIKEASFSEQHYETVLTLANGHEVRIQL